MLRLLALVVLLGAVLPVGAQTLQQQILERTNIARLQNNLPPLKGQLQLDAAAQGHSDAMASRNFFSHTDPANGSGPGPRIEAAGYPAATWGENIAAGNSTAAATMTQWLNSSGHLANIMNTGVNELGVGYGYNASSTYRHYWTQVFGRRSGVYPLVIAREAYQTATCSVPLYVYGSGFATQMRFSTNGGSTWSAWQSFATDLTWPVIGASGTTVTVMGEIRNASGTVRSASDSIRLAITCGAAPDPMRIFSHRFE